MRDPSNDTALIPCRGCNRDLIVPAGPVRAAQRLGRSYITFCSRRCERRHVAMQGARQQEEQFHARHRDADPGIGS